MGYELTGKGLNEAMEEWAKDYAIYGPRRFKNGGRFSDTDCIRYGEVTSVNEIVFDQKSEFSFKEVLLPVSEILFYYTEDSVKEADGPKKGALIFLRSCDLHGVKRLDEMYLHNGPADSFYRKIRERVKFVLMGCERECTNGFCVDMGTNICTDYDLSVDSAGDVYRVDCKNEAWDDLLHRLCVKQKEVVPAFVTETSVRVKLPEGIDQRISGSSMWREYDSRCIGCGRCNFVCPTCTCFSMQDIKYSDNEKAGERRRVWSSCMVEGYTEVAGGGSHRKKNGDRMRFKVLHKFLTFKKRAGYHMCVGCGRCDDICPEYISFSDCVNRLEAGMKEVAANESQ